MKQTKYISLTSGEYDGKCEVCNKRFKMNYPEVDLLTINFAYDGMDGYRTVDKACLKCWESLLEHTQGIDDSILNYLRAWYKERKEIVERVKNEQGG